MSTGELPDILDLLAEQPGTGGDGAGLLAFDLLSHETFFSVNGTNVATNSDVVIPSVIDVRYDGSNDAGGGRTAEGSPSSCVETTHYPPVSSAMAATSSSSFSSNSRSSFSSNSSDDGEVNVISNGSVEGPNNLLGLTRFMKTFAESTTSGFPFRSNDNNNDIASSNIPVLLADSGGDEFFQDVGNQCNMSEGCNPDSNICCICGAEAGKHTYYGGKACSGCRAFFRRAVQSRYFDIFTCIKSNGKCNINETNRRDCQYCRFQKCLSCGMKPSWVLTDSERDRRFNKRRKVLGPQSTTTPAQQQQRAVGQAGGVAIKREVISAPQNQNSFENAVAVPVRSSAEPIMDLAVEDWNAIEKLHGFIKASAHKSFHDYLVGNPSFMHDLTSLGYFGGSASQECYMGFRGMYERFANEFYIQLEDSSSLPVADRRKLMAANGAILGRFKSALNILEVRSCLTQRLAADTKSGLYPALSDIAQDLERMDLKDRRPHLSYSMFYCSPWTSNPDDEMRHFELMHKIKSWPRDSESKPLDSIQISLMKLIIAFSTDWIDGELERPDLVRALREKYIYLLQRYLRFKYKGGDADRRFAEGLRMAGYAREAEEIQKGRIFFTD